MRAQPYNLAQAGLYYDGPHDRVKCAFCLRIFKNWTINDDPKVEHQRYSPNCAYVKTWTIEKLYKDLVNLFLPKAYLRLIHGKAMSLAKLKEKMKSDMNKKRKRGKTYIIFYSSNELNIYLYFYIFIYIYIYIIYITEEDSDSEDSKEEEENNPTTSAQKDSPLICEKCNNNDKIKCKICLEEEVGVVMLPCRHVCSCYSCSAQLISCPVCRTNIHAIIEVYIS